jgi:hypothetical protein
MIFMALFVLREDSAGVRVGLEPIRDGFVLDIAERQFELTDALGIALGALRYHHDSGRKFERGHYQQRSAIGTKSEKVAPVEPVVETGESMPANLRFTTQIATERGHGDVTPEAPTHAAT